MLLKGKEKLLDEIFYSLCYQEVKQHYPNNHICLTELRTARQYLPYSHHSSRTYKLTGGFIFAHNFRKWRR